MISIILCDDHEIVRQGLRQIINNHPSFTVLCDVANGEELLKELRLRQPDILILDIALPGRSGLEVLKQVKCLYPQLKVLVLSMYPEDQFAIRMIKAGASGYLHKDSPPETLNEAIKTIADGGKYVSSAMMELLFTEIASEKQPVPLYKSLSDREFEVLLQIGNGKKLKEVAASMALSIKTVSTYKSRLFEKLGFKNEMDAAGYLAANELLAGDQLP